MEYHESYAILLFGIANSINTTSWDIHAIPAAHLATFRDYVVGRRAVAIDRLNEPDDPADQAWWHERVNEWDDILRTLSRRGTDGQAL